MLGKRVACAAVSPHLYILSYVQVQCYLTHSGSCTQTSGTWIMEFVMSRRLLSTIESNPDMGHLRQETVCFSPDMVATATKVPLVTMSVTLIGASWDHSNRFLGVVVKELDTRGFRCTRIYV